MSFIFRNFAAQKNYHKMKKTLLFLSLVIICMACNSDKAKIEKYLNNNYSDREIEVVGEITIDSAFCPLSKIDEAALQIMGYKAQLQELLVDRTYSAIALANSLKVKFTDNNEFVNMAYPKGANNRLAYMVKCNEGGRERVITFFKSTSDDFIESSSLDVDEAVDSLLVSYNMLMDGVRIITQEGGNSNAESKESAKAEEKKAEKKDAEEQKSEKRDDDEKASDKEEKAAEE